MLDHTSPYEECLACAEDAAYTVTPDIVRSALRDRAARTTHARQLCPRCDSMLGPAEIIVDAVGYAHGVQPCVGCAALWVL